MYCRIKNLVHSRMATLDDRLLGEKLQYYCSSSEDEDEDDEEEGQDGGHSATASKEPTEGPLDTNHTTWEGSSTNTGPKGVLRDWQRYKQLEAERRDDQERERILLAKKLTLTCRSQLDDEKEKEEKRKEEEGEDVDAMLDEEFLRQYISRRMEEMVVNTAKKAQFGRVLSLEDGETFLDAVDKEDPSVTVIIHIYHQGAGGCEAMDGCLVCLAQEYPHVKFCRMPATAAGVSTRFKVTGLPALLVYKAGHLMGNFVRLIDEFGDDFYATDVEAFLIEHGMLVDKSLVLPTIRSSTAQDDADDSDFSLDD
ncbi:hypothetical protein Pcinc_035192 [Petrolisthes cinctipes]|uniref:Phosducin domain-containing protein n=1 Tax=Petrolisthes cinctipes TaxID=88211 RepID=A0AAE1C0C1_PETCI|nr:hypothetical protein Pcinc_035192 [Petrolisthes cinctipes]